MVRWTALFCIAVSLHAQTGEDAARGKKLFEGHCGLCHGQTALGGRGPNLTLPNLKYGTSEEAMRRVIQDGIPGTEMPGAWQMTPNEVTQVVAYLRSLARTERVPLPGDAARGKQLFFGKAACHSCHIVGGQGTALGPELTLTGVRRNPAYLRQSLLQPEAAAPEGYLLVTAIAASGAKVTGARVNEDSFTIQIMDAQGKYHSFRKSALREIERHPGKSGMPSYDGKLSASDLDDLVAYMAGLRGE
jgi:putative heme-binding domain-containing protein